MIRDTVSAMNRKVPAIIMALLLTAALISSINANALTSVENKALKVILGLTQQAKNKLTSDIQPTLKTVRQDLQFKQKFWEYEPFPVDVSNLIAVGVAREECKLNDPTACAFTVESIQTPPKTVVIEISVDDANTGINEVRGPSNLLVDSGIGSIGASNEVNVVFKAPVPAGPNALIEFNGEKPQGMKLCTFGIDVTGARVGIGTHPCQVNVPD